MVIRTFVQLWAIFLWLGTALLKLFDLQEQGNKWDGATTMSAEGSRAAMRLLFPSFL